jgi:hypothetical protein
MSGAVPEDLVVLVADKNIEHAIKGLLEKHQALGIRSVSKTILVHMHHDPGCLQAAEFLRPRLRQSAHAMVLFDREGCGQEKDSREQLEHVVEEQLAINGWRDRSAVVVLDPEIESWVWSSSPQVDAVLGWKDRTPSLREWLRDKGHLTSEQRKPLRPKEALEAAVRETRIARSSSIYEKLARTVSFARCEEPSFLKFCAALRRWFGSD